MRRVLVCGRMVLVGAGVFFRLKEAAHIVKKEVLKSYNDVFCSAVSFTNKRFSHPCNIIMQRRNLINSKVPYHF